MFQQLLLLKQISTASFSTRAQETKTVVSSVTFGQEMSF
jgi:hypothetical protein